MPVGAFPPNRISPGNRIPWADSPPRPGGFVLSDLGGCCSLCVVVASRMKRTLSRCLLIVVMLAGLAGSGVMLSAGVASASTPCNSTEQVVRQPRLVAPGMVRGLLNCNNKGHRYGKSGDRLIGHNDLTGRVCIFQSIGEVPIWALACGSNFSVTAYVPNHRVVTGVEYSNGTWYFSGSVWVGTQDVWI